jgi:hypothetical protein
MANPGLIRQTTLEAATEGVQVITKAFEREIMEDAGQLGWFVDVTNDTFAFMQTDRDFKGFVFGAGGADTWDMGLKRLGSELMSFRNYPDDDDQVDFRVRELQASRIPHANVIAWGATGDGTTDDRSAISNALTELKTAGGGELFLPPGTFRMSTGISESDLKGITIRGAGITATTLKLDDVAVRHFIFTSAEGITFKDLTFQGAGSTTASNAGGGVNMPLGSNTFNEGHRFENLQFLEMSETAIEVPTSRGLVISNVKIDDNNLDMVELDSAFAASIESLIMTNGQQRGLYIHSESRDVTVRSSRSDACGIGFEVDQSGVYFQGVSAVEGANRSASFPGYGFVVGHTESQVLAHNVLVSSAAGITPIIENSGGLFRRTNYAVSLGAGLTFEDFNMRVPDSGVRRSTDQPLGDSTFTSLTFDTVLWNHQGLFDATDPDKLTIPIDGRYLISAFVSFASASSGYRRLRAVKAGSTVLFQNSAHPVQVSDTLMTFANVADLLAGDEIELQMWQNTGTTISALTAGEALKFSVTYLGS